MNGAVNDVNFALKRYLTRQRLEKQKFGGMTLKGPRPHN